MKKSIAIILFVLLIASMLMAADTRPIQPLNGTLGWSHMTVCGPQDFVSLHIMENVYLTGNFNPTNGLFRGCTLHATGSPYMLEGCHMFAVQTFSIACNDTIIGGHR